MSVPSVREPNLRSRAGSWNFVPVEFVREGMMGGGTCETCGTAVGGSGVVCGGVWCCVCPCLGEEKVCLRFKIGFGY